MTEPTALARAIADVNALDGAVLHLAPIKDAATIAFIDRLWKCTVALKVAAEEAERDLLAALKVCGVEPPESAGEPWALCIGENGSEEGGDTAEDTARMVMAAWTEDATARESADRALAAMREALKKYGRHKQGCRSQGKPGFNIIGPCDCGLAAALGEEKP